MYIQPLGRRERAYMQHDIFEQTLLTMDKAAP
jgi:hypothetical protein